MEGLSNAVSNLCNTHNSGNNVFELSVFTHKLESTCGLFNFITVIIAKGFCTVLTVVHYYIVFFF